GLGESLEEFAELVRGHADAGVGNVEDDGGALERGSVGAFDALHAQTNRAFLGELAGVAQEVEKGLAELGLIGVHRAEVRGAFDKKVVSVPGNERLHGG